MALYDVKKDIDWATKELITSVESGGYEKLIFIIDKGRIVHVVREKALKPPSFDVLLKNNS
jgi:hypothetical protein